MYRSLAKSTANPSDVQEMKSSTLNDRKKSDSVLIQIRRLSADDRLILQETFNLLEKDLVSNGIRIFLKTISENPHYKFFWPQFRAIPDSSLISSSVLRDFACTYMKALKTIVESLKTEQIPYEMLRRISTKHAAHNIQIHHIQKMMDPLLENVCRALGRRDENAERAWKILFQTIGIAIEHCKSQT
uniref:Globin family profile domain-containing protein n=1 Tax=Setaria digitata TaxID=48799 RepID=A0A915PC40_9BILA